MSKLDSIKTELAFYEKLFFFSLAMSSGIIAWLMDKYISIKTIFLFATMLAIVFTITIATWSIKRIWQLLDALENE